MVRATMLEMFFGSVGDLTTDEILLAAAELANELPATDTIYMLVPTDDCDDTLNQRNGRPRWVSRAQWPRTEEGALMRYLFTLDLDTMPELRSRLANAAANRDTARAVAFFVSDPPDPSASALDFDVVDCATVVIDEPSAELDPADSSPDDRCGFRVVPARVPEQVWTRPDWDGHGGRRPEALHIEAALERMYGWLGRLAGRCGGRAMRLQPGEPHPIVMQFDQSFVDGVNLGDNGVAYWSGETLHFDSC